jgi:hypothetical protein
MNWESFGVALAALAGGCALRALLPYVLGGLRVAGEKGWGAWPPFEAKYVTTFLTAIVLYAVALLTVPGAAQTLADLPLIPAISLGYGGGDIVREGAKLVAPKLR